MATYSKPARVPRWADTSVNIVEPPGAKKDEGWLFQEIPPSSFENDRTKLNGDWWKWIDERMQDGANNDIFELIGPAGGSPYLRYTGPSGDFELIYTGSGFAFLDHSGITTRLLDVQGIADNPWLEYVGSPQRLRILSPTSGPGTNRHAEFLANGDSGLYDSTTDTAWLTYTAGSGLSAFPGALDVAGAMTTVGITASGNVVPGATLTHNLGGSTGRWDEIWGGRSILTDNLVTPSSQTELASRHANNLIVGRVTATIATTGTTQTILSDYNVASVVRDAGLTGRYIVNLDQAISSNCTVIANLSTGGSPSNHTINPRQSSSTIVEFRISDADTGTPTYLNAEVYLTIIGPPLTVP